MNHIFSCFFTQTKNRNGIWMKQISKRDIRYKMLLKVPKKDIFFVSERYGASYVFVLFSNSVFSLTMTEYYDVLRFIMNKDGSPLCETRYIYY
jgi:hypothetical protein